MTRTKLGAKLWAQRQKIIASGVPYVDEKGEEMETISEYLENRNRNEINSVFTSISEKIKFAREARDPSKVLYHVPLSEYELIWLESAVEWFVRRTNENHT